MKKNKILIDSRIDVKLKLAALWISFMFLYLYVDYFSLYMPEKIEDITQGKVFVFQITQSFIFTALGLASLPISMIFLSLFLPARPNRVINFSLALIHIPYMLFNLAGEAWIHMIFAAMVEVILLLLIARTAWQWPTIVS